MTGGKIQITGLREFQRALKAADAGLPQRLKMVLADVSDTVIKAAEPDVPNISGAARGSLKRRLGGREARIAAGGRRAPYYPWLDFGGEGRVRGRPAARPFIRGGRYLYPALDRKRDDITQTLSEAMTALARDAGLDVT